MPSTGWRSFPSSSHAIWPLLPLSASLDEHSNVSEAGDEEFESVRAPTTPPASDPCSSIAGSIAIGGP